MPNWTDLGVQANVVMLQRFGLDVLYSGNGGESDPISIRCIKMNPEIQQSATPGYFADIQVDPLVVTAPRRGDLITWPDGCRYSVGKVLATENGLTVLAIHKAGDSAQV